MGIRENIANAIGGKPLRDERARVRRQLELLIESQFYIRRDPQTLARELEEVDSQLLDLILEQRGWQRIGGAFGTGLELTEIERVGAINTARYMTYYDTQSKLAVNTWTDFGFGQSVHVVPRDDKAKEIWDEFWTARRNQSILNERVIHEQSNEVVKTGELFYSLWTEGASGFSPAKTTIRNVVSEDVGQFVTMNDDPMINVWFVQDTSTIEANGKSYNKIAYRACDATDEQVTAVDGVPDGAIDASELRPNTSCVMLYAARNRQRMSTGIYRGWPEFNQAYVWFRAYRDALQDVLAKNRAVAMYVDKLRVQGGSRAIDSIAAQLGTTLTSSDRLEGNPTPVPGATWLENQQAERTRMPLGTAAGDDRVSTMIVLGQAASGTQVPLGWMGRPDSWQNKSVADMSVLPWNEAMQRYQSWWSSVFKDMARIVLTASGVGFSDEQIVSDVTLDTMITVAIDEIVAIINAVVNAVSKFALDQQEAQKIIGKVSRLALTRFGVADVDDAMDQAESDGTIRRIINSATRRLRSGNATPEAVAEWALGELFDVVSG